MIQYSSEDEYLLLHPSVLNPSAHGCEAHEGEEEDAFAVAGEEEDSWHGIFSPRLFDEVVYF